MLTLSLLTIYLHRETADIDLLSINGRRHSSAKYNSSVFSFYVRFIKKTNVNQIYLCPLMAQLRQGRNKQKFLSYQSIIIKRHLPLNELSWDCRAFFTSSYYGSVPSEDRGGRQMTFDFIIICLCFTLTNHFQITLDVTAYKQYCYDNILWNQLKFYPLI